MIDYLKKMTDFCDWLEEERKKSPFSAEAWEEQEAENSRLRVELKKCKMQEAYLVSQILDLLETYK
jgi:hypothetical protein